MPLMSEDIRYNLISTQDMPIAIYWKIFLTIPRKANKNTIVVRMKYKLEPGLPPFISSEPGQKISFGPPFEVFSSFKNA